MIGSRAFVREAVPTNKLEHRAWEGRLVGFSEESKSCPIYNSETRRVRVSQNVIFIEAPSVTPSLNACGFDDGDFTYGDHDDMLRDVENYTSNHSTDSLSLLDLHLVRRCRLVHHPLVLLRLVLRRRVVLCVDAVRLVVDEVPRRRLLSPGLLRVEDLPGEASRSAVDVAAGLHVDVVLVVDEVPRRRLQPPGLLRA